MRHLILFIGLLGAAGCASLSSNSETYDILDAKFDRKEEIEGFNFTGKFVTFINDKGSVSYTHLTLPTTPYV